MTPSSWHSTACQPHNSRSALSSALVLLSSWPHCRRFRLVTARSPVLFNPNWVARCSQRQGKDPENHRSLPPFSCGRAWLPLAQQGLCKPTYIPHHRGAVYVPSVTCTNPSVPNYMRSRPENPRPHRDLRMGPVKTMDSIPDEASSGKGRKLEFGERATNVERGRRSVADKVLLRYAWKATEVCSCLVGRVLIAKHPLSMHL